MASFFSKKSLRTSKNTNDKHPVVKWFGRFLMGLGVLMLLSLTLSIISIFTLFGGGEKATPIPDKFVMFLPLTGAMNDMNSPDNIISQFMPHKISLYGILRALETAKDDDRVQSLAVKISDGDYSLTQIQTLRKAILDFRANGKKAMIYTDSFGGASNGVGEYWLASAFDEIWVQPIGTVSINGIRVEQPFFEDALDKVGVDFQMEARKDYKTGPEMYLRNDMSPANRETIQAIVDDIMLVMMDDVTGSRGVNKDKLNAAINNSPLTVEEAKNMNLITHIGYLDEFEDSVKGIDGGDPETLDGDKKDDPKFVSINRYQGETYIKHKIDKSDSRVAIVKIEGAIMDVDDGIKTALLPDNVADGETIANAIMGAADNDNIKVILLRVNSPGGSPSASETIRRAVVRAREKGKYVIASMSDTAASGGYWVVVDADEIIASPLTLTGSIGVYGGKPNLNGLWDKLGVTWGAIEYGQNASMWSPNVGYNATERKRLNIMMDRIYDAFTQRVAQGRKMNMVDVEAAAQGRAWTGLDAKDRNLVDNLGGFEMALTRAAEKAEYDNWKNMPFILLPYDDDPFKDIAKLLGLPSIADMPKIPQILMPVIFQNAIVTAPTFTVKF